MSSAIEPTATTEPSLNALIDAAVAGLNEIILGKETQVRLCLACLFARGHLLIEDIPGVGKTTLAHALARSLGLSYQRIQFTSDLLPADIIGVSVFEADTGQFRFHRGPVFAQLVLADEVNRATPKAQSALLEAMEEHQVTADGQTYPLTEPFFVIATQNPSYQVGTYPLPESQLDRFLMRIELGYPAASLERQLLLGRDRRDLLDGTRDGDHAAATVAPAGRRAAGARVGRAARLRAGRGALHATGPGVRSRTLAACRDRAAASGAGLGLHARSRRRAAGRRASRAALRRRPPPRCA